MGWPSVPGPSSLAWCPPHWGMCCSSCLWRGLGLPGPSPFTSPFSLLSSQLPAPPKFNFHIRDSWNSGRPWFLYLGGGPRCLSLAPPTLLPGHALPSLPLLLCVPLLHLKRKGWRFQGSRGKMEPLFESLGHIGACQSWVAPDKVTPCLLFLCLSLCVELTAGSGTSKSMAYFVVPGGWTKPFGCRWGA